MHLDSVDIAVDDKVGKLKNDFVVVSAGGILPTAFLKTTGINVETKWGTESLPDRMYFYSVFRSLLNSCTSSTRVKGLGRIESAPASAAACKYATVLMA
jgi:hypothetical protein